MKKFTLVLAVLAGSLMMNNVAMAGDDMSENSQVIKITSGNTTAVAINDPADAKAGKVTTLGTASVPVEAGAIEQLPNGVGVSVKFIVPNSPAEKANLKVNDVLYKFNDQWVVNAQQLKVLIRMSKPGDKVKLSLYRDKKPMVVTAELAEVEVDPYFNDPKNIERDLEEMQRIANDPIRRSETASFSDDLYRFEISFKKSNVGTLTVTHRTGEDKGKVETFRVTRAEDGSFVYPNDLPGYYADRLMRFEENTKDLHEHMKKLMQEQGISEEETKEVLDRLNKR